MKIKFDPNQQFQLDAINAVVDIFDGQPPHKSDFEISFTSYLKEDLFSGLTQTELGLANQLTLDNKTLLENIKKVQELNELPYSDVLEGETIRSAEEEAEDHTIPYITVEMETGTGKTYVYLRTIFEMNQKYGFKKFIIVVPSVAIREGVNKNIEITQEHFRSIYNGTEFDSFVYDSSNINSLRQFATSNTIQIMIINIDAFRKNAQGCG
jgi:type III restriction enzyme